MHLPLLPPWSDHFHSLKELFPMFSLETVLVVSGLVAFQIRSTGFLLSPTGSNDLMKVKIYSKRWRSKTEGMRIYHSYASVSLLKTNVLSSSPSLANSNFTSVTAQDYLPLWKSSPPSNPSYSQVFLLSPMKGRANKTQIKSWDSGRGLQLFSKTTGMNNFGCEKMVLRVWKD